MFEVVYLSREFVHNDIYGMEEIIEHDFFVDDLEFHQWLSDMCMCGIEIVIKSINENITIDRLKTLHKKGIISHSELVEYISLIVFNRNVVSNNKEKVLETILIAMGIL